VVGFCTDNIGIRFSKIKYNLGYPDLSNTLIDNFSHVKSNSVVTNVLAWTKIKASFIADSNYTYITIGNFYSVSSTSIASQANTGNIAYYYIDEVCVSTDSMYTENYITNVNEWNNTKYYSLMPNPAENQFKIIFNDNLKGKIYNINGELIWEFTKREHNDLIINSSNWKNGIYFIITEKFTSKIIINH
jgi:hypothetical protein